MISCSSYRQEVVVARSKVCKQVVVGVAAGSSEGRRMGVVVVGRLVVRVSRVEELALDGLSHALALA